MSATAWSSSSPLSRFQSKASCNKVPTRPSFNPLDLNTSIRYLKVSSSLNEQHCTYPVIQVLLCGLTDIVPFVLELSDQRATKVGRSIWQRSMFKGAEESSGLEQTAPSVLFSLWRFWLDHDPNNTVLPLEAFQSCD